jgi:hypothetical protein
VEMARWGVGDRGVGPSLFYSGPGTRTGQCGTGFIIISNIKQSYLGFEPL